MGEVLPLKLLVTHLGDGRTTDVLVAVGEQTSSIAAVKERISELDGIEAANQYLFRVDDALGDGDDLGDDEVLCASCELYLFVGDTRFKWDSAGAHVAGGIYALVNATTVHRDMWPSQRKCDAMHFMRTHPSMRGGDTYDDGDKNSDKNSGICSGGIFTISLKITRPDDAIAAAIAAFTVHDYTPGPYVHFGLLASDLTKKKLPCFDAMMSPWRVVDVPLTAAAAAAAGAGASAAAPKNCASGLQLGSVITMTWDANTCTLQFFIDGKRHISIVQMSARGIPLQWAVAAACPGTVIEIVECEDDLVTIKD
jgi:hypothetical protein